MKITSTAAIVLALIAFVLMATTSYTHIALCIACLSMVCVCIVAAVYEREQQLYYKKSNVLLCDEGIIRNIKIN